MSRKEMKLFCGNRIRSNPGIQCFVLILVVLTDWFVDLEHGFITHDLERWQ